MNQYRRTTYGEVADSIRRINDRAVSLGRPAGDD